MSRRQRKPVETAVAAPPREEFAPYDSASAAFAVALRSLGRSTAADGEAAMRCPRCRESFFVRVNLTSHIEGEHGD